MYVLSPEAATRDRPVRAYVRSWSTCAPRQAAVARAGAACGGLNETAYDSARRLEVALNSLDAGASAVIQGRADDGGVVEVRIERAC